MFYIVTILVCDYRWGMDWKSHLLTTYTHDSELHVITELSLIYTLYITSTRQVFSFLTIRILATDL
jgi:hypothetical protein